MIVNNGFNNHIHIYFVFNAFHPELMLSINFMILGHDGMTSLYDLFIFSCGKIAFILSPSRIAIYCTHIYYKMHWFCLSFYVCVYVVLKTEGRKMALNSCEWVQWLTYFYIHTSCLLYEENLKIKWHGFKALQTLLIKMVFIISIKFHYF